MNVRVSQGLFLILLRGLLHLHLRLADWLVFIKYNRWKIDDGVSLHSSREQRKQTFLPLWWNCGWMDEARTGNHLRMREK